jgi:tetratricopeptide (TPR) repeat protein
MLNRFISNFMLSAQELEERITQKQSQSDPKNLSELRNLRKELVECYPYSALAAESYYRLGLDALFAERNLELAREYFAHAAKLNHQPYWSATARISLALCLYHQHYHQEALFELRKVAFSKQPSLHSLNALHFIEEIYHQLGESTQVQNHRAIRKQQASMLLQAEKKQSGSPEKLGFYLCQLAEILCEEGEIREAHMRAEEALMLGKKALGETAYEKMQRMLNKNTP